LFYWKFGYFSNSILTFVINLKDFAFEAECVLLEETSSKRLLLNSLSEASLVKIISQTNTTTILAPCSSFIYDELNNSYHLVCPYKLGCNIINLNYIDKIQVLHNDKCCFDVGIYTECG
jgi:hypothetical protein